MKPKLWYAVEVVAFLCLITGLAWYFFEGGWIGLIQGLLIAFIGWAMVEWMGDVLFPGLMPKRKDEDR